MDDQQYVVTIRHNGRTLGLYALLKARDVDWVKMWVQADVSERLHIAGKDDVELRWATIPVAAMIGTGKNMTEHVAVCEPLRLRFTVTEGLYTEDLHAGT